MLVRMLVLMLVRVTMTRQLFALVVGESLL